MELRELGANIFAWLVLLLGMHFYDSSFHRFLTISVVSWTRGTGLMSATNIVAHELESYGVCTFSAKEMAFNILGLMHPLLLSITQVKPIWADLNGGMDRLPDLADVTTRIRLDLNKKSELRHAIARDNSTDFKIINGIEAERLLQTVDVIPRANFQFDFPILDFVASLTGCFTPWYD
jgi:fatty acid synthase subunit beta